MYSTDYYQRNRDSIILSSTFNNITVAKFNKHRVNPYPISPIKRPDRRNFKYIHFKPFGDSYQDSLSNSHITTQAKAIWINVNKFKKSYFPL